MARYECVRCHAVANTTEAHLCKDVLARLRRREAQVTAILPIIEAHHDNYYGSDRAAAEAVVRVLANMGVQNDV